MEKETADIIIQLFTALTNWSQDHWAKLHALEWVLELHPEMRQEYQQALARIRAGGAAQTNSQSASAALDNLRANLLRD